MPLRRQNRRIHVDRNALDQVSSWANRGTLRQFQMEAEARLVGKGYASEIEGSTLTFYRREKEGGLLGIGGEVVHEPVAVFQEDERSMIRLDEDNADPEFISTLATELSSH
jgi:hypothetical protein